MRQQDEASNNSNEEPVKKGGHLCTCVDCVEEREQQNNYNAPPTNN